jgi:hypothetical protein
MGMILDDSDMGTIKLIRYKLRHFECNQGHFGFQKIHIFAKKQNLMIPQTPDSARKSFWG